MSSRASFAEAGACIAAGEELPESYQCEAVQLFSYWMRGLQTVNVLELSEQLSQEFLAVAREYFAHKRPDHAAG